MALQQAWSWDLEEMRSAGRMAEHATMLAAPRTLPRTSGFTPINEPQLTTDTVEHENAQTQSGQKSTTDFQKLGIDAKKRKGQASNSTTSKRPRKNQLPDRLAKTDISKAFQRTKPGLETTGRSSRQISSLRTSRESFWISKDLESPAATLEEQIGDATQEVLGSIVPTDIEPLVQSRPLSLAERYRAGYDNAVVRDDVVVSTQYYQRSPDGISNGPVQHSIPLRSVNPDARQQSRICQATPPKHSPSLEDFLPPPSGQPLSVHLEKLSDPSKLQIVVNSRNCSPHEPHAALDVDDDLFADIDAAIDAEHGHSVPVIIDNAIVDRKAGHDKEWLDNQFSPEIITIFDEEQQELKAAPVALHQISGNIIKPLQTRQRPPSRSSENEFDDGGPESSLVELDSPAKPLRQSTPQTSPLLSSSPKLNWLPPKTFTPAKSPSGPTCPDMLHLVPKTDTGKHQPFVRPPFPDAVRDRSPILGLTNTTVLRTCFRIGEALNAAAQASRSNVDALVELYARVFDSSREANGGFKQVFQFADLFTDKPPYLSGTSSIWKGVKLWDQDSGVFLGDAARGSMCRVVGRIKKRERQVGGCEMTVLSIWKVDWEDVGIAKGAVCS